MHISTSQKAHLLRKSLEHVESGPGIDTRRLYHPALILLALAAATLAIVFLLVLFA